jgi:surface protein
MYFYKFPMERKFDDFWQSFVIFLFYHSEDNECQVQALCNNSGSVFITKNELQGAVNGYLSDKDAAISLYGLINCWDVTRVTDMSSLFYLESYMNENIGSSMNENIGCWVPSLNENIGCWDVSNVTSMAYMFYGACMFNQDIGIWNVSNVQNMYYMFASSSFNQNIGEWDVSSVNSMSGMFYDTSSFNQDISRWNISQVQDLSYMFYQATMFNQSLCNWFQYFTINMPYVYSMFSYSGCPLKLQPNGVSKTFFCQKCEIQDGIKGMLLTF